MKTRQRYYEEKEKKKENCIPIYLVNINKKINKILDITRVTVGYYDGGGFIALNAYIRKEESLKTMI